MATNAALVRPSYITDAIAAKEAAKQEEAYQSFRNSLQGWDCRENGGRSMRSKKVILNGRLTTQYYAWKPNPHKEGTFQHRAWDEGYENAQWEDEMGYDL